MIKSETIRLAGGSRQHFFRAGSGPALVWLHGVEVMTANDPVVSELAKRYSVIAPVAPGYDDLAEIADLRNVHDLALHYDEFFEALGLDQIVLVGHSFGGMIAAEIAAHVPRRVKSLVLLSPLGLWNDDYPVADLFARPYHEIATFVWEGASRPPAPSNSAQPQGQTPEQQLEALVSLAQGLTAVTQFTWPIPDKGLKRRLYRIKAPTLVVFGANDTFVPAAYVKDFAAGIAKTTTRTVPGASHMAPYEDPAGFADMIGRFAAESA